MMHIGTLNTSWILTSTTVRPKAAASHDKLLILCRIPQASIHSLFLLRGR